MAEKRMFTKKITDTDAFLEMPLSTQALYFHLNMHADDDGFVGNPRRMARLIGASEDDLRILIAKRFILVCDATGVIVIKHWRMHNTLRMDRYHPTEYQEELSKLFLKTNNSYTDRSDCPEIACSCGKKSARILPQACDDSGNQMATNNDDSGNQMATDPGNQVETNCQPSGTRGLGLGLDLGLGKDLGSGIVLDGEIGKSEEEGISSFSEEKECRTPKEVRRKDVDKVIAAWNSLDLKQVERISPTSKRGEMTRKRIREYGVYKVLQAIENIRHSRFLNGDNKRGWMATYDWFILPNNFQKVLEGNYDDQSPNVPQKTTTGNPFLDSLVEDGYEFSSN